MRTITKVDYPPLTEEQRVLCPFGDPKCKLCQLPPKILKQIHTKRIDEEMQYSKISKTLKIKLNLDIPAPAISNHFRQHVHGESITQQVLKKKERENSHVTKALQPITEAVKITTSSDIEKAYESLVKIRGVKFILQRPPTGEKLKNESISKALQLLSALLKRGLIRRYDVEYIDVSDKNNCVLNIQGVLVKMGYDDFTWKINKLNEILRDPDIKLDGIAYIDLRFENAVISPK